MDRLGEFMRLQDLDRKLKYIGWDELNLTTLHDLRSEITQRMNKIKRISK